MTSPVDLDRVCDLLNSLAFHDDDDDDDDDVDDAVVLVLVLVLVLLLGEAGGPISVLRNASS